MSQGENISCANRMVSKPFVKKEPTGAEEGLAELTHKWQKISSAKCKDRRDMASKDNCYKTEIMKQQ